MDQVVIEPAGTKGDSALLGEISRADSVPALRAFLKANKPTRLSDIVLLTLIDRYWDLVADYKVHEDLPLLAAILNDRASKRQASAGNTIAGVALLVAIVSLVISLLPHALG